MSVTRNLLAFQWGRAIALQPDLATTATTSDTDSGSGEVAQRGFSAGMEDIVELVILLCFESKILN